MSNVLPDLCLSNLKSPNNIATAEAHKHVSYSEPTRFMLQLVAEL